MLSNMTFLMIFAVFMKYVSYNTVLEGVKLVSLANNPLQTVL